MFTTGTKLLLGATVFATLAAIGYGVTQEGLLGTIGLISAAVALAFIAGVNIYVRDSNIFVDESAAIDTCDASKVAPRPSAWPLAFAFGAVVLIVGLVSYQPIVIIGLILVLAAGAEWTTLAWAERASSDSEHNSEVRSRIANPLEFPLAGALAIGVIIFSFSRVMLWLSKTNTVIAFGVLGVILLAFAFLFAYRPGIKSRIMVSVVGIAAIGIVAGGAAAGVDGQREIHPHETTEELSTEGICEDPEETEADEKASQRVAATAAVAATVILNSDGTLTYEVSGPPPAGSDALTLPRSNANNVLFRNQSSEPRRLSVDLGTEIIEDAEGVEEEVPAQVCTALIDDGGVANVTLTIALPSFAFADGYHFFVPGVDTAVLELVVP